MILFKMGTLGTCQSINHALFLYHSPLSLLFQLQTPCNSCGCCVLSQASGSARHVTAKALQGLIAKHAVLAALLPGLK